MQQRTASEPHAEVCSTTVLINTRREGLPAVQLQTSMLSRASLPDQHSSRCQSGRIDPCMVPKGLAAAVLASAVKIAPNFPMAAAISNLLYTILIYSILGTVIAILAVEATGRRSGPLRMALSIRERAPLTRRLEAFGPQYGVFPVRLLVRRGHLPSGKLLARSWTTILDSARF